MSIYDSQKPKFDTKIILLVLAVGATASAFIWAALLAQDKNIKLGLDLCPISGPTAQTIVLLDVSDPLNPVQRAALESLLHDFRDESLSVENLAPAGLENTARYIEKHEVLQIYTMENSRDPPLHDLLRVCNPGGDPQSRSFTDELVQGEAIARQKWIAFEDLVQNAFSDDMLGDEQKSSPLLEAIAFIAQRHGQNAALVASGTAIKSRLIIFSDMVQNSKDLSHFNSLPSWERFSLLPNFATLASDLNGFSIGIIYVRRSAYSAVQTDRHFAWWPDVLVRMNGGMLFYEPIPR